MLKFQRTFSSPESMFDLDPYRSCSNTVTNHKILPITTLYLHCFYDSVAWLSHLRLKCIF